MTIDSLNLLAYQAGLVATPLEEQAASAARDLCTEQKLMRIGDPLPVVFCRRIGDVGGVLVSPAATEARFENSSTNVLTASWHLVVSEGPIDPIEVRDVFQCACRVGSATQAYGTRAGRWNPGNVIVDRGGTYTRWDLPRFCGSPGTYDDLHTLSFVNTYQDGEVWNRAVHLFIRGGTHVTRLVDGVTGPSCNVVDLYLLLLRKVERIPENLIDLNNLRHAALFTEALGMRFDGNFSRDKTQSLDDWRENVLKPYFLLQATRINGKEGLMPLLPTNPDGSIFTGVVRPHAALNELDLDLSGWDLQFLSLADRRPICAQMMWRQQGDGIDSIVRTTPVRFRPPYDAPDGPFEQHDLSEFACSERHIAKVGAYAVAHRALVHHTLRVPAIPGEYNRTLADGMIVRVRVPRVVDGQAPSTHDYLYRVVSIEKDLGGTTVFNLVHFPVDAEGRSAVAMAVRSANPSGLVLPIAKTGAVCDVNSSLDTTDLLDDSFGDDYWDLPGDEMFDILLDGMLTDFPLLDLEPLDLPPLDPLPLSFPSSGTQVNPDLQMPQPDPNAQTFDLKWESLVNSQSTGFTNQFGEVLKEGHPFRRHLDWMPYYVENIHTWLFLETVSQQMAFNLDYIVLRPFIVCGIVGINWNEREEPGYFGYKIKFGGDYQGGGSTVGPTLVNGTNVYRSEVRNLYMRPHNLSGDWQPVANLQGIDGDKVYPTRSL